MASSTASLAKEFASHGTIDHSAKEDVRGDVTTNHTETYFGQLKRPLDGTRTTTSAASIWIATSAAGT